MKNTLQKKIFFLFLSVIFVSVSITAWYGVKKTTQAHLGSANSISMHNTRSLKTVIEEKLLPISQDIMFMSDFHALKNYLIWDDLNENRNASKYEKILSNTLIKFLETKQTYYKVRVIGLDGIEKINVTYNENSGKATAALKTNLQDKSKKDYIQKAFNLNKGQFYVSEMNLNMENGVIKKPYLPVVRYSTPIYNNNGEKTGIFVVNIYAHYILELIEEAILNSNDKHIVYYLVDKDGNYLYNIDPKKQWGKQLNHKANFNKEHFNIDKMISDSNEGVFTYNDKIYSYSIIYPLFSNDKDHWYVISSVEDKIALANLGEFYIVFAAILFFVVFVSFYIVKFYVSKFSVPIVEIARQLKALSLGETTKEKIVYGGDDEIGDIVDSTANLVQSIETTILQANAVANGDFTREITLLSEKDQLGYAIKEMTLRLSTIAELSKKLSHGDYDVKVKVKSSRDNLGLALRDMVSYLKDVSEVASKISVGDLETKYISRGADDKLGNALSNMITYLQSILYQANAIASSDFSKNIESKSKHDKLGESLAKMTTILRDNKIKSDNDVWFSDGISKFNDVVTGEYNIDKLLALAIKEASKYVGATSGVVYIYDKKTDTLALKSSYSFISRDSSYNSFKLGEGLVGQVGLEKSPILLTNVSDELYRIQSGTTQIKPKSIFTFPILIEDELLGVVECTTIDSFTKLHQSYLKRVASILAVAVNTTSQNIKIKDLLDESQKSYEELQIRSEELQESNVQMEEQQQQLTLQAKDLQIKNDELLKTKEELDHRAEELEKSSKYKSEFLANMSHELRTPLNSIILLSKLLTQNKNNTLADDDVSKTTVINKAGNDLLLLINDILDLSKVESGKMELSNSEVQTSELVEELNGLFYELAKEKGLEFKIEDNYNSMFIVDKIKLLQVIKNLLSNAFKFTKNGYVKVVVDKKDKEIVFKIIDSGIGIPQGKLKQIFEAFKQVDGSISREYGGTGLGLSISTTFIELMGGHISVTSVEREGSESSIYLPLDNDVSSVHKYTQLTYKDTQSKIVETNKSNELILVEDSDKFDSDLLVEKNILIVDDDSRNIFTLSSVLQEMGADTFSALNGEEACRLLEEESEEIDIILMDIMMPVMDGLDAIKKIKKDDRYKHIPIIAITAKTMKEDKQRCFEAGANDYLAKPIEHNALISMLKAWSK